MIPIGTNIGPSVPLLVGDAFKLPVQCYIKPMGTVAAQFTPGDTIEGSVYRKGIKTPLFSPSVTWYTRPDKFGTPTQTGYDQGQVWVFGTSDQAALFVVGNEYFLVVDWAPSSDPANSQAIAFLQLSIGRPY